MSAITQGELRVNAAVPIADIKELHMEIRKNDHASIRLSGIVPDEAGDRVLLQALGDSRMEVWTGENMLFSGVLREVRITHEGSGYDVEVEGCSASKSLDYGKKKRTFQKTDLTYKEVMQSVLGESGAKLIYTAEERKIRKPLYQIEETDWEFVRRLASHLGTAVFPSVLSAGNGIYVGLPAGRTWDGEAAEAVRERIYFDKETQCVCQDITVYDNWNIGDRVKWQGREYAVISKSCRLKQGLVCFTYGISREEAFSVSRYGNPLLIGMLLPAVVLETKDEQVKVHFDMDKAQPAEDAYWYPWYPDVGNLMYCMPEKGEKVYVHLDDCEGTHARVVCGVHGNGEGHPEMDGASRYFTTADNKRLYLLQDSMGFCNLKQKNPLEVVLDDSAGARVESNKKIVILAKEDIGLKGKNVSFRAPQELSIVRRDALAPTVLNMCNGFDSVGGTNEVSMKGAATPKFPVFHESAGETGKKSGLHGLEKDIVASTPGKGYESREERVIGGTMVNQMHCDS